MAREAFRSLYGDLTKLKDDSLLKDPAGGAGDDNELFQLLLAVSDWIDGYCNRHFYPRTQTLLFDGNAGQRLLIPDLISLTTLKEDTTDDATFDTTWAATDYFKAPYNAEPTQIWGQPYTSLAIRTAGTKDAFKQGDQIFEIVGSWGYRQYKELSGSLVNEASITASETDITVDDGTHFAIGQTIMAQNLSAHISHMTENLCQ